MIEQKFIDELKSKNEIVEVVSAYCSLERKGGAYWARCPLPGHMEKTASFCVNQEGQFFKCFGCQRGGDVIKFIMEVESLTYVEAVKFLANRVGMEMPTFDDRSSEETEKTARQKQTKLAILKDTARFYVHNLATDEGQAYIDYMSKRGFDNATIRAFGIGCSLDYQSLPEFLKEKGYAYEDMLDAGVVSFNKETNKYMDFEAKRLTVPIIDAFSNVLAFGGRVIVKTEFAKYKNTRETSVFVKNRTLFNINNIKKLKREKGSLPYIIMVEGYMDVIALYAAGIKNVVASMGTSLTVEQARLLLRYTDTVVISYDGDAAGQHATFRGLQILKDAGLTAKIISLPDNLDPDEFVKAKGVDAYTALIADALPLIDYKLEYLKSAFDVKDTVGRRKYIDNALRVIGESDKAFEREELLKKLSAYTGITYESLSRELENKNDKSADKSIIDKNQSEIQQQKGDESSALVKAERFVLSSVLTMKDYAKIADIEKFEFSSLMRKGICDYLIDNADDSVKLDVSVVCSRLGEDYLDELNLVLTACDEVRLTGSEEIRYYNDCLKTIERVNLRDERDLLKDFCKEIDDFAQQLQMIASIDKKTKRLKELGK